VSTDKSLIYHSGNIIQTLGPQTVMGSQNPAYGQNLQKHRTIIK